MLQLMFPKPGLEKNEVIGSLYKTSLTSLLNRNVLEKGLKKSFRDLEK